MDPALFFPLSLAAKRGSEIDGIMVSHWLVISPEGAPEKREIKTKRRPRALEEVEMNGSRLCLFFFPSLPLLMCEFRPRQRFANFLIHSRSTCVKFALKRARQKIYELGTISRDKVHFLQLLSFSLGQPAWFTLATCQPTRCEVIKCLYLTVRYIKRMVSWTRLQFSGLAPQKEI